MTGGVGLIGPLLETLVKPRWWALALAAFLVRGGILVMILPIVTLPTLSGLTNTLGPAVTGLALGGAGPELLALVAGVIVAITVALVAGGLIGAWLEVALVREVFADDELRPAAPTVDGLVGRGFAVHILAHLPLVVTLAWGIPTVIAAGYTELILPEDLATPLAVRIAARVPLAVALIVGAWVVGEAVGGLALRQLVAGRSVPRALFAAVGTCLRRPVGALTMLLATQALVLVVIVPALLASSVGWDRVRIVLADGVATGLETVGLGAALVAFVALWLGGFVLAGLATAVRAVAWTAWSLPASGGATSWAGAPSRDPLSHVDRP